MKSSYHIGETRLEPNSRYLTLHLPDSSSLLGDADGLRRRLAEDGFLYLRRFHDPEAVLTARREMLGKLQERGLIDSSRPLDEGIVDPQHVKVATSSVRGNDYLKTAGVREVLFGERTTRFFDTLFGEPSLHLQFEWLRAAPPGASSPIHCDRVYMGRGSQRLLTLWTPFGRITPEMGPLALCLGSHEWSQVVNTYGQDDVDRDRTRGVFTDDPLELVETYGGRWATTTFEPGDAVILTMYNLHASLRNDSDAFRLSCDTRYQPASDPVDERWAGSTPPGHDVLWKEGAELESVSDSRKRWGLSV
ncbi:phytanoyl-CoA dioxygenase family protein [Aeoliella sp. SH292]|uniref:phytanoyl-CoA dioxygenase family protein n=1 Tax=Aeoliella sp. SH292 TaxID=3454464 RepID=UPI003F982B41